MKEMNTISNERLIWVDWMKVLGMYFIIAGHFFPIGNDLIYMFNVPLFFVISGFLTKQEGSSKLFWNKLYHNLLIPLLIICLFMWIIRFSFDLYKCTFSFHDTYMYWAMVLLGQQKGGVTYDGLGTCWFIYTLMLLKIVNQYINRLFFRLLFLICCILVAYYLKNGGIKLHSAFADVVVSYPFFLTGFFLRMLASRFNLYSFKCNSKVIFGFILLLFFLYMSYLLNGAPMMYRNEFGDNFLLFYLGGVAGTAIVLIISMKLNSRRSKMIETLSVGTIIILGFHGYFIEMVFKLNNIVHLYLGISSYFFSILILLIFYPIINLSKKYIPNLLGKRK